LYGFADASGHGFGSIVLDKDGIHYRIRGVWDKDTEDDSLDFWGFEDICCASIRGQSTTKGKVVVCESDETTMFVLLNNGMDGGRLDELIEAMQLDLLMINAFFKDGHVVVKDYRQNNRDFLIGVTGGQSTLKKLTDVA
jgi:hypothetical protein